MSLRTAAAAESLWIEAEHFDGITGYCWPQGRPEMRQTNGNWGLSGPGWAADWNQGGESGFLSIATAAEDANAVVTKTVTVPAAGSYTLWVRYADYREAEERFEVRVAQPGREARTFEFGLHPKVEEDNEIKLYFDYMFAWDGAGVALAEGDCQITLASTTTAPVARRIDVVVITDDPEYQPLMKERPTHAAWEVLEPLRGGIPEGYEPLARRTGLTTIPDVWRLRTFRDAGFRYLWNVDGEQAVQSWLSDNPAAVRVPYSIRDEDTKAEFDALYAGRSDVPIFGDPRIVPTFHGAGAGIFATDPMTGQLLERGQRFAAWLDAHPDRPWAMMMNYHPETPIGEQGIAAFQRYRDRYIGSISGESLGYFYPTAETMQAATAGCTTRRQLVEAMSRVSLESNAAKYRAVYGRDLDANAYSDVIPCLSVGNICWTPICFDWGARIAGYESHVATSSILGMRWAFMRGAARQWNGLTATYRSCNFGDSATIFSNIGSFHSPQNILDNYYSVYSGAGMTWYKFDIWHQYQSGSSMFYHEQGFDEFWRPGGTTAAGIHPVQLSPKGRLVDRFLRLTADAPDRGTPFTPVAFLVDYAHGWEPSPYWPNAFKNWHQNESSFRFGIHEKMLEEFFWLAFHPIGPESERPITALNEVYVPGVFGDMFDVIFAYPDVSKWRTIDSYPVVIVAGEIELTDAEGQRLAAYVNNGGTLFVSGAHLTGPGLAHLQLPPATPEQQAGGYYWLDDPAFQQSPRFRYQPIDATTGRALATTDSGDCFCAAFDRGAGRLIYLSVPHGLTISRQASPVVAHLMTHLTRNQMPVEVDGDVEWFVNQTDTGWLVTLLNPAGQNKPQQGITPTDYSENRDVTITTFAPIAAAYDRLSAAEQLTPTGTTLDCVIPAGAVRIVELQLQP
jgi:hypothetical protein